MTSKAKERLGVNRGKKGVESSVEMDIKCPDVQESLGENPQPRRDEGLEGNCRQL